MSEKPIAGKIPFRPYARLISVLGDQLISDKWIGVIELVKNSYDADASEVKVFFKDFSNDNIPQTIEIWDDGHGMTKDDVLDKWMKPATPNKLNNKKGKKVRYTKKKRIMQGDKGVGRFAIYKLGNHVELYTKTKTTLEVKLTLDFAPYAEDSFEQSNHTDLFLDQIENDYETNVNAINIESSGTLIKITNLRDDWKKKDLKKLSKAFYRMMPPNLPGKTIKKDFDVSIYWDLEKF